MRHNPIITHYNQVASNHLRINIHVINYKKRNIFNQKYIKRIKRMQRVRIKMN
jgi:hypothetical protein